MKNAPHILIETLVAFLITLASSVSAAPTVWSGAAGDASWSAGGNWSPAGMPGINANVIFTNDGVAGDIFTVNNVVDLVIAINALGYMNTNGFHHTHIVEELHVLSSS